MQDLVEGKKRVLLNFAREFWIRNQEDKPPQLGRKWGFPGSSGHFGEYVDQLVQSGHLRRFNRNGKAYIRLTWKGEIAVLPLLLPKLLMLFILVVSLSLFTEATLALGGHAPDLPEIIMAIAVTLLVFSFAGLFLENRLEKFLLGLE